ncbi:MAG: alpha-tubulin suppressor-like RCC1 family protein, partial [Thermoproteota archaeon]
STLTGNGFANVDTVANGCNPGTDFLFPTEWTPLGNPSQTLATSPGPVNVVNVVGFMIMAGQTEHILKFKVCGDAVYEIEEQYALTLGSIYDPNAITDTTAIFGALPIYTIYIQDGGVKPNISFTTPSQIIPEDIAGTGSGNTATMSVSLNVVSDYDIKVPIASIAGYGSDQATTPADFTFPAGWNTNNNVNHVITIPAGSLSADTIFTIVSDTQIEKTEAFESVMGQPYIINPNQYTISKGNVTAHVVYIGADTGDDEVPDVYFASTSLYVNESEGSISPYIQLTEETAFTVLVAYQVTGFANPSEAEVDKDYILYDGILEIQPGQTIVAMPPIPILDDYDYEYDEGFKITIVSAANADFGAGAANLIHQTADYAEITIVNDDALPQIAFSLDYPVVQDQVEPSIARQEVYETPGSGGTEVKVKLVTNGTHVASMEVGFSIMGTATQADLPVGCPGVPTVANNRDYRLPLHTDCANTWTDQNNMKVTFAPGETEKEVSFMIYDDYLYEMAETIIISMLAPSNALIGGVDTHIITITDTDPLPKPTFTTINQVVYEPKMCTSLNNNWGGVPATIPSLEGMDIDCDTPADVTKISTLKLSGLKEVLIKIKTYIVPESKIVIPIRDIIGDAVINGDYLLPSSWNNFPYQVSGQPIFSHPTWYIELDPFEPGVCTHLPTDLVSSYGDCTAEVKFTILDDNIYEADDTISISMGIPYLYDPNVQTPIQFDQYGNPIGSLYAAVALDAGSIQTTDITILNDTTGLITKDQGGLPVKNDPPPTVKFKVASQALDEFDDTSPFSECSSVAGRQVVVSFELDEISSFGSLINIGLGEYEEGAAISGPKSSAKPGFDHDLQANTFFMNAGVKEDYQTFCILDDVLTEGMEEIVMTLANPINAVVSTNPVDLIHRVQIKHNDPIKVVAGVSHTCAIISERLKCWGNNSYGQLGLDTVFYSTSVTTPVKKFVNLGTDSLGDYIVKDVTLGAEHTCVLLEFPSAQGTLGVKCFGRNNYGQTGIATIENAGNIGDSSIEMGNALQFLRFGDDFSLTPLQPTKVVSGGNFTCVLFSSGDMKCFGENTYGQLGRNDKVHRGLVSGSIELMDPIDVGTNWSGAVDIAVTGHSACALGSNRARCWGRNEASELGITSCVTGVGGGTINYNSLISSLPQTCSSIGDEPNEMDGSAWGMDDYARASNYGHAGLGFEWLIGPNNITGASNGYSYCMDHLGFKTCFGYNANGILGRDHTTHIGHNDLNYLQEYQSDPAVEVSPNNGNGFYNVYGTLVETDALEVSMGYEHSCALLMNGEVKCLGKNTLGQNGRDQAIGYNFGGTSTQLFQHMGYVLDFNDVQDISAGQFYTCAVEGSNKVKCWGSNGNGQLGIGNTTASFGIDTVGRQMSDIPFIVFPALDQREVTLE